MLWEFWKRDIELFPNEILTEKNLSNDPHCLIFVFDGSLDEVPNGIDEIQFYK